MMNTATTQSKTTPSDSTKPEEAVTPSKRKLRSEAQWDPQRPLREFPNADAVAHTVDKVAVLLMDGKTLSRRTIDEHGLLFNGPLHSYVSDVERKHDLPVDRKMSKPSGVKDYWASEETRAAMAHPATRKVIAQALRRKREEGMLRSGLGRFEGVLSRLELYPELMELHPWVESVLRDLAKRINSLLGANNVS